MNPFVDINSISTNSYDQIVLRFEVVKVYWIVHAQMYMGLPNQLQEFDKNLHSSLEKIIEETKWYANFSSVGTASRSAFLLDLGRIANETYGVSASRWYF